MQQRLASRVDINRKRFPTNQRAAAIEASATAAGWLVRAAVSPGASWTLPSDRYQRQVPAQHGIQSHCPQIAGQDRHDAGPCSGGAGLPDSKRRTPANRLFQHCKLNTPALDQLDMGMNEAV